MKTKELIIICTSLIICITIVCGTIIYLNHNNHNTNVINKTNQINYTTSTPTSTTPSTDEESDDWFGYVRDQRTNILPYEHAEWQSTQIDKAESRGFDVTGCNTDGIRNGYDVYTKNGEFAGHIN